MTFEISGVESLKIIIIGFMISCVCMGVYINFNKVFPSTFHAVGIWVCGALLLIPLLMIYEVFKFV